MLFTPEKTSLEIPSPTALEIADLLAMSVRDTSRTPLYRDGREYMQQAVRKGEMGYGLRNDAGKLVVAASTDTIGQSPDIAIRHMSTAPDERRRGHARALLGIIAHEAAMHPTVPGIRFTLNTERPDIFKKMGFTPSTYDARDGNMAAPINKFL